MENMTKKIENRPVAYLTKICVEYRGFTFLAHPVYGFWALGACLRPISGQREPLDLVLVGDFEDLCLQSMFIH